MGRRQGVHPGSLSPEPLAISLNYEPRVNVQAEKALVVLMGGDPPISCYSRDISVVTLSPGICQTRSLHTRSKR